MGIFKKPDFSGGDKKREVPEGLWQNLTAPQQRDLMTFLLTERK